MILNIKNVSLKIPRQENFILRNINYEINPGDFIIILGSNGSGKSSLLKLIDRRYYPTAGKIEFHKKSLEKYPSKKLHNKIITLTQNYHESLFVSLTVFENCLLAKDRLDCFTRIKRGFAMTTISNVIASSAKQSAAISEREFFAEYLKKFNPNLSNKLNQLVENLSGGEKQALALALSVLYPPEILLLDEHTSALDPHSARELMALTDRIVKENNITCILATHNLDIAMKYGTRILALRQGEIYQTIEAEKKQKIQQQELLTVCY